MAYNASLGKYVATRPLTTDKNKKTQQFYSESTVYLPPPSLCGVSSVRVRRPLHNVICKTSASSAVRRKILFPEVQHLRYSKQTTTNVILL